MHHASFSLKTEPALQLQFPDNREKTNQDKSPVHNLVKKRADARLIRRHYTGPNAHKECPNPPKSFIQPPKTQKHRILKLPRFD